MTFFLLATLIFASVHLSAVESANILAIFPLVQKSHYAMFSRLMEELARKGHSVDVLGGIPNKEKSIPGLSYIDPDLPNPEIPTFTINDLRQFTINFALKFMFSIHANAMCKDSFETEVMKNLRDSNKKYDLLILEVFICDCYFGFAHIFNVPVVSLISSTDLPWGGYRIGNPDNPAYISNYFQGLRPHKSLYEKSRNTIAYLQTKIGHWWYTREQNKISKRFFGPELPDLNDIVANISVLLMNSHFSMNLARPAVPNFIEVGGLHIGTPKPLDKQIDNFISKNKFIYFSLGSIANSETFEADILKNILAAFSELEYKVLWKANGTELASEHAIPSNVLVQPWMPQLDILCHPNIALFITHAGLMGTQESIHCGVPMLCMPLFADQYQNCQNMVDRNIAETLAVESLNKAEFKRTIEDMINNPRYMEHAKALSAQFKDRPMSPLDTSIYWIEYVLRHNGAPQLKSLSSTLSWYQYHLIDVICIFTLFGILGLVVIYVIFRFIFRKVKNMFGSKNDCEIKKKS